MSKRSLDDIRDRPLAGDAFEVLLPRMEVDPLRGYRGEIGDYEIMLRVMCVVEEHVVYKEYGLGRFIKHLPVWKKMLAGATKFNLLHGGDEDLDPAEQPKENRA